MYRYHFIVGITFNPTSYTTIARRKRASECATQTYTYDSEFKVIIFGFDQNILLKAFQIYTYIYIGPDHMFLILRIQWTRIQRTDTGTRTWQWQLLYNICMMHIGILQADNNTSMQTELLLQYLNVQKCLYVYIEWGNLIQCLGKAVSNLFNMREESSS